MADIFLSHSEQDRKVAQTLAEFLEGQGWTVWWGKTAPGSGDHQVRMAELASAKLVIVIWSRSSVAAPFVLEEAVAARDAGKLMHLSDSEAPPKTIPVRRRDDPLLDVLDLLQISLAVSSYMRR